MASIDLDRRLRRTLTRSAPLGPSDAAQISDIEVAAHLFDPHNKAFNTLVRRDLSLLLGRRGSGKTALLNSYKYQPFLDEFDKPSISDSRVDFRSYDLVIDVVTYKQFDEMQRLVARDPTTFRPVESLVDDWATLVTDYFFAKLVTEEGDGDRDTHPLQLLRRYLDQEEDGYRQQVRRQVWGGSLISKLKSFLHHDRPQPEAYVTPEQALQAAVDHLAARRKRVVILFDSMDEYDITNSAFTRSLGALIRFIAQFNAGQDRIKIKLGLPLEIFPEVQRASANPLKDLVSVDQLKWTSMELAQIAAHRFRLFLTLYDSGLARQVKDFDLNKREHVRSFWTRFLPVKQVNRYGREEEAMTYILRHTQLLPRQLLMILQRVIVLSAGPTNNYSAFTSEAVTQAIVDTEPLIATEILSAFSHIYPFALDICRPVFANFPTVFSYDHLEDKWRRKGRPVATQKGLDFDMAHFGEMLIRIGIVGIGHDETDRYYQGVFGYDSLAPANIGEGQDLCLHPIFSRHFSAAGNDRRKAVIPQGAGVPWI